MREWAKSSIFAEVFVILLNRFPSCVPDSRFCDNLKPVSVNGFALRSVVSCTFQVKL